MSHSSMPDGPKSTSSDLSTASRPVPATRNSPRIKTKPLTLRNAGSSNDKDCKNDQPTRRSDTADSTQRQRSPSTGLPSSSTSASRSPRPSVEDDRSADRSWTPSLVSSPARSRTSSAGTLDGRVGIDKNALADAIVASSLASRHARMPRKEPPPVPPHRRGKVRSLFNTGGGLEKNENRSPSPRISLPQTLRSSREQSSDDAHYHHPNQRHNLHKLGIHKHPHKHHEGDRKRWRSEVTEKERKRYEGVWAANKGILIPSEASDKKLPPDASNMVVNLVVRDIWSRSGLPRETLEKIWDLVNGLGIGLLRRDEFVIGMWLIDQQLKGHKLPERVPHSVWNSVRHTPGIKAPCK